MILGAIVGNDITSGENNLLDSGSNHNSIKLNHRNTTTTQIDATVQIKGTITRSHAPRGPPGGRGGLEHIGLRINSQYSCSCDRNRRCSSHHDRILRGSWLRRLCEDLSYVKIREGSMNRRATPALPE